MEKLSHKQKTFEERLAESKEILKKYPDRLCIYIEPSNSCKFLHKLDKNKYLVPNTISVAQLMAVIRSRITLPKEQAMFFLVNNCILSGNNQLSDVSSKHVNKDGFLYITYCSENAFG